MANTVVCKTTIQGFESLPELKNVVKFDMRGIKENLFWNILKRKLDAQIEDCGKYGGRFQRPYREVLKMMEAIENGTEDELIPNNCVWKTKEEIEEIYKYE